MAWIVTLEDENNTKLESFESEFSVDNFNVHSINKEYKLFHYIDPYGDTVFNRLQIDDLLSDLKKLKEVADSDIIDGIIKLALKCKAGPHTYLKFYGD